MHLLLSVWKFELNNKLGFALIRSLSSSLQGNLSASTLFLYIISYSDLVSEAQAFDREFSSGAPHSIMNDDSILLNGFIVFIDLITRATSFILIKCLLILWDLKKDSRFLSTSGLYSGILSLLSLLQSSSNGVIGFGF